MGAFLKVSYNQIPRICQQILVTSYSSALVVVPQAADALPVNNLFYGGSSILWRNGLQTAVGQSWFELRLRDDVPLQTVDHVAIRGLNLMFKQNSGPISIEVRGSLDYFVSSDVLIASKTNILSSDLTGTFLEDYIFPFAVSGAYQQFRVKIITTNQVPHRLRKINIGKFFDFSGISPYYPYVPGFGDNGTPFTADAGSIFKTSTGRVGRVLNFVWRGVTDADRIFLEDNICRYLSDYPIFLYEPSESDHEPLSGKTSIYGWGKFDLGTKEWKNNNQIGLLLIEDIVG